jgi:hypothetical protein
MKQTRESKKAPSAESIAKMADRGEDVSRFFTNRGKMMQPIQRVNVDFTASMLQELRRVSSTLRHPAWEFTDFLPGSFGPVEPAC